MRLYVVFNTVHLQKETFGAFYIKFYLKILHKNDLKATQILRGSLLEVSWKNLFLKISQN